MLFPLLSSDLRISGRGNIRGIHLYWKDWQLRMRTFLFISVAQNVELYVNCVQAV